MHVIIQSLTIAVMLFPILSTYIYKHPHILATSMVRGILREYLYTIATIECTKHNSVDYIIMATECPFYDSIQ